MPNRAFFSPRRPPSVAIAIACALGLCAATAQGADRPRATLPLKTVRLYEAGVGYFERSGDIARLSDVSLPVPAAHLDDALKTLVVLGAGANVAGIEFRSAVSPGMARAVAGLPTGNDAIDYAQLVRSLRGVPVELRAGHEQLKGRVLDVVPADRGDVTECVAAESKPPAGAPAPCALQKQMSVLVLTDHAELRRFRSSEVASIRPTDESVATRLGSALDALTMRATQAPQPLHVVASTGGHPVTLGYVAEAPVWRATYRLVFGDDHGALQGWALIHNDTDEDWTKVKVSLESGRPDSFLYPLAAPRYARRELVTPDEPLSTVPQLLGRTADALWGDDVGDAYGAAGLGLSGVGEGGGGRGEGIGLGQIGTVGHGSGTGTGETSSAALSIGNLASLATAEGVEAGALFRYALASPIDVRAHASSLVPFLQKIIAARRITYFADANSAARAAARLKNDTGQTLPAGTIAFFAEGGFAGEARIDRLKAGDGVVVGFGADLDVDLATKHDAQTDRTRLLVAEGDALVEHFVRHYTLDYDIVNHSATPRTVYLGLPIGTNARVKGADEVDFDRPTERALAVFKLDARSERSPRLEIDEGKSKKHALAELTSAALRAFAKNGDLPAAQRKIVAQAAVDLGYAEARRAGVPPLDVELGRIETDLDRLRRDAAAVRKDGKASEMLVLQIVHAEEVAIAIRARIGTLQTEASALDRRAREALKQLKP